MKQEKFSTSIIFILLAIHLLALAWNALHLINALETTSIINENRNYRLSDFCGPLFVTTIGIFMATLSWMNGRCFNITKKDINAKAADENVKYIKRPAMFTFTLIVLIYAIVLLYPSFWAFVYADNSFGRGLRDTFVGTWLQNPFFKEGTDINPVLELQSYYTWVESVFAGFYGIFWKSLVGVDSPNS